MGILVIKAIEFPVDLRRDLNAPCLHSLWGGAGNINDSPFYLIPCQKQSLWGAGPGGHLAQSCFTHFLFLSFFYQRTHFQDFFIWPLHLQLVTDNLIIWCTFVQVAEFVVVIALLKCLCIYSMTCSHSLFLKKLGGKTTESKKNVKISYHFVFKLRSCDWAGFMS